MKHYILFILSLSIFSSFASTKNNDSLSFYLSSSKLFYEQREYTQATEQLEHSFLYQKKYKPNYKLGKEYLLKGRIFRRTA